MSSRYDVIVDTPKYHRQGALKIDVNKDEAIAQLEIFELGTVTAQGTRDGKDYDFTGVAHFDEVGDVAFEAHASTWANSIDCKAQTDQGEVVIYGTMTGLSAGDYVGNDKGFAGRWADDC